VRDATVQVRDAHIVPRTSPVHTDAIYVNEERTVLVSIWANGNLVTVATRDHPSHTWGPPVYLQEEK
jgi:hypothetical protein